jgi:hypothetical protein
MLCTEILTVVRIKANTRMYYVGGNAEVLYLNVVVCEATTKIKTLKNITHVRVKPFCGVEPNFCGTKGLKNTSNLQ